MSTERAIIVVAACFALSGCGNLYSVFHTFDANNDTSISIDVKQRVVLSAAQTDSTKTTRADGTVIESHAKRTIVCAEPSPDALSVLASSASASAQTGLSKAIEATLAQSETGAFVGLRTQTIQLLRDGMYRLCEGYMSGALDRSDFHRLQRRYQQLMMGLLAIEQLTGAVAVRQVVLTGGAASSSSASRMFKKAEEDYLEALLASEDAELAHQTRKKAVEEQKKALDAAKGDDAKTKVEQNKLDDFVAAEKTALWNKRQADEKLKLRKADYENTKAGAFASVAGGGSRDEYGPTSVVLTQSAQSTKELADAVTKIVANVINTGFGDEDCTSFLTSPPIGDPRAFAAYLKKCFSFSETEATKASTDPILQNALKNAAEKVQSRRSVEPK